MKTVKVPDLVDYPDLYEVTPGLHLFNKLFVYVIEPYPLEGSNLYIGFREDQVLVRLGDFKSNDIDMSSCDGLHKTVLQYSPMLVDMMKASRILEASYYFSHCGENVKLVDMMLSANKFAGPGMLRDLFRKILPTQEIVDIKTLDDDILKSNKGKIVKPSRFRYVLEGNNPRPQYGTIV